MEFQLEEGLKDIMPISVVFPSEVIGTLVAHESVAIILILGDPCLKCRCKVVEWGVAKEDLPDLRRDFVQLRLQKLLDSRP